jgi:hypothetical protein
MRIGGREWFWKQDSEWAALVKELWPCWDWTAREQALVEIEDYDRQLNKQGLGGDDLVNAV